jgi:dihydroorotase
VDSLTLVRPDDWHLHLREGEALRAVLPDTAARFARAIVMPNLRPPVTTVEHALRYRAEILAARPAGSRFEPLMTLYLTPATTPAEVERAAASEHVHAIKLYPAGATTNSDAGVSSLDPLDDVFTAMTEHRLPLLIHGESTDAAIDVFDREKAFLDGPLTRLRKRHPGLRIVVEHITTADAVAFVREAGPDVAATITAHHLLHDRNAMFQGGLRPHFYCLPVLKRARHRDALIEAAVSGEAKFFLGTDSAPHARGAKESACGCAGIYTAHAAIELYAEAFDLAGRLAALEGFASIHGARWYGLPINEERITLVREAWRVPASIGFGGDELIPMRAGESVGWRMAT